MSSDFVCWSLETQHTRTYWTNTQLEAWRAVKGYIMTKHTSTSNFASLKNWEMGEDSREIPSSREKFAGSSKNLAFRNLNLLWPADCHQVRCIKAWQHNTASCNISVSLKGQPNALAVSCWCLCFAERSTRDLPARDVQSWHYPRSSEQKSWNLVMICGRGGDTRQRPSILSRETLLPCLALSYLLSTCMLHECLPDQPLNIQRYSLVPLTAQHAFLRRLACKDPKELRTLRCRWILQR